MFKIGDYVEVVRYKGKGGRGVIKIIIEKRDTLYYGVKPLSLFEGPINYYYPSQIKKVQPYTKKDLL